MIKNEALKRYVMYQLNKNDEYFSEEDLEKITEISLNYNDTFEIDFKELLIFNNLNSLTLCNYIIDDDNLYKLLMITELKELTLNNCILNESSIVIATLPLSKLCLNNCKNVNNDFIYLMNSLKSLHITNSTIDINKINKLENLELLDIGNSKIINLNDKFKLHNLTQLYIDNSNINDLTIISNLDNLSTLGIDSTQYDRNKMIVEELKDKGLRLYLNGFIFIDRMDGVVSNV